MKFALPSDDLKYLYGAGVFSGLFIALSLGFTWAIYILMAFMGINAIFLMLACGAFFNFDVLDIKQPEKPVHRNAILHFLLIIFYAIGIFQIHSAGFIFWAGFFTFMVAISISVLITYLLVK